MKNKLFFTLILFFVSISSIKSQNLGVAADLGYKYQTRSLGYTGVSYAYTAAKGFGSGSLAKTFSFGGGSYWGSFNGTFKFIPAGYISAGVFPLDAKITASPYFINPSICINGSFLGKLDIGYSFPLKNINGVKMKGLTIAFTFFFGTRGYYVDVSD